MSFAATAFVSGKPSVLQMLLKTHKFSSGQLYAIKEMPCPMISLPYVQGQGLLNEAIHKLAREQIYELRDSAMKNASRRHPRRGLTSEPSDSKGEPKLKRRKTENDDNPN